jgi:hypothetical protein
MGAIWGPDGSLWELYGGYMRVLCEPYGSPMGAVCESYGSHVRARWESDGSPMGALLGPCEWQS